VRSRLVAAMVGLTLLVLAVHDIPLVSHLRRVERDRVTTELERDAFTIAGRSERLLEELGVVGAADATAVNDVLSAYFAETGGRVVVTDSRGLAVASSDEESVTGRDYSTRPEIASSLAGEASTGQRFSETLGFDLLFVSVPVILGDEVNGAVRITYPESVIDSRVSGRLWGIFFTALMAVAVAVVFALLLAYTITRPLSRLRHATEQVGRENFEVEADETSGPAEVRVLARSFNRMSARLGALVDRQRGFAGDASHQLRTPLTALRLRLEQVDEALISDPASARIKLDAALHETERLQRLTDGLLALARAEARSEDLIDVDVRDVVIGRVAAWSALSVESGVNLRVAEGTDVVAKAMPGVVEQILDNFIDNAVQYAPSGSEVEVSVGVVDSGVFVTVADRGPGMSAEQCERALDRFWRAPDAAPDGTGLGLAIASRLAEASGGRVSLRPREGGGLVAELVLVRAD